MHQLTRRSFLKTSAGAALFGGRLPLAWSDERPREKLPVAAVVTEYRRNSHADVIIGKILEGWKQDGGPGPDLRLAALYVDQLPPRDMSRELADKYGFRLAETIEEAVTLGSGRVAVAGVLSIGEHGKYDDVPETKQKMYPRRRFFDGIANAFREAGQVVPVFNDKHLAYSWKDAKHMYDTARELNIPLLAGSSLPVAWREPPLALPLGSEVPQAVAIGYGGLESYGFHALEMLQCFVERRKGGETGVAAVQAVRGDEIGRAEEQGRWSRELLKAAVATTPPPPGGRPEAMNKDAVFYLIEYRDGLKAAVAMNTRLANEFAVAAQERGKPQPQATRFRLQDERPFGHFAHLLRAIEHTVHTGEPAYPVERTLLTTGVLDALLHSLAADGRRIETPHLAIRYEPADWPFAKGE